MCSNSVVHKRKILRSDQDIFLVGKCASDILGSKLPSIKQVLQLLFYKIRVEHKTLFSSMKYSIGVTMEFWKRANIPTMHSTNCIRKLKKIYEKWRKMQRNCESACEKHRKQEHDFQDEIQNFIFDIATPDALETIKIKEDRDFLVLQRMRGRQGIMHGVDANFLKKEKRKEKRLEKEQNRVSKYKAAGNYYSFYKI